jgi:hypothetical protein
MARGSSSAAVKLARSMTLTTTPERLQASTASKTTLPSVVCWPMMVS